ncbi:hypothetical protein PR048_008019 [Dryococelus australis]|uniref:DDE Tnp4 domain-containing protein n=1 Tax=Dryococelus australis TaxID=614101 RepID=A0ABQ9HVW8_9NEOP|nr:hypothetical protein PR048_008019 [Dryococelus australis]
MKSKKIAAAMVVLENSRLKGKEKTFCPTFEELMRYVSPLIYKQDTRMRAAISVKERLALALQFPATGGVGVDVLDLETLLVTSTLDGTVALSWPSSLRPSVSLSKVSVSWESWENRNHNYVSSTPHYSAILKVGLVHFICKNLLFMFQAPSTSHHWLNLTKLFADRWDIPKCCGALDGKHVVLQSPAYSGSYYYNYKGQQSTTLMALVDAEYKFILVAMAGYLMVVCLLPVGYRLLWKKSLSSLEKTPLPGRNLPVPNIIVADDEFPLKPYLLKPFPYNYRLSRARRIVENVIGIVSAVFRVLRKPLLLNPDLYALKGTLGSVNSETGQVQCGMWREEGFPVENLLPIARQRSVNYSFTAKDAIEEFMHYFVSPVGEVP